VTSRTLVAFFEIIILGPWSSFSFASYNELTEFQNLAVKLSYSIDINSNLHLRAIAYIFFFKQFSAPPEPLARLFSAVLLKIMLVRCIKRLKFSFRGLGWDFLNSSGVRNSEKIVCPQTSPLKLKIDTNYKNI
jgi:hypothetical protein